MRSSTRHFELSVPDQERRRHGRYRRLRRTDQFDGRIGVTVRPVRRTPPRGMLAHRDPIQPRRHHAVADRDEVAPREPVHPRTRARRGCRSPQGSMSWRCELRPTALPSLSGASGVVVRRRGRRRCRRGSGDRRRRGLPVRRTGTAPPAVLRARSPASGGSPRLRSPGDPGGPAGGTARCRPPGVGRRPASDTHTLRSVTGRRECIGLRAARASDGPGTARATRRAALAVERCMPSLSGILGRTGARRRPES